MLEPVGGSGAYCNMKANRWLQFPIGEQAEDGGFFSDLIQHVEFNAGGIELANEDADWYRLEQPIKYHTNVPAQRMKGVYVHSFAIRPEEYAPSGFVNFTPFPMVKMTVGMSKPTQKYMLVVYGWGYNVLRIHDGSFSLAF